MTQSDSGHSWHYRPDIEGLRAIAILGVILFHAGVSTVSGGFLGVDVFFVISGFLITGILIDEVSKTGTVSLAVFWSRRARRLLPAATIVSLVTLVLSAHFDSAFTARIYARSAIAFATYWSNLLMVHRRGNYFDVGQASDPFLHTWSLAVEEQYYLVFAPLILLLAWMVRARGIAFFRERLLAISVTVTIGSFVGALLLTAARPVFSFYALPSRAWEFGVGTLLALAASRGASDSARPHPWLALVALGALLGSWFIADDQLPHPGVMTLLPVLSTGVLILMGGTGRTLASDLLESRPMRVLGRLSYSWYLWHWPVTVYWSRLIPGNRVPLAIGMPIVSLGLAQLTYIAIESRARRSPVLGRPRVGLPAAGAMAALTVAAALGTIRRSNTALEDPKYGFILEASVMARSLGDKCLIPLYQSVPNPCTYGQSASDTTVVLFGDSHAGQWFPTLEMIATARGWRLITLTKSACPAVSISVWTFRGGREYTECSRWRAAALGLIPRLKPSIVFMASSSWYSTVVNGSRIGDSTLAPAPAVWKRGLEATLDRLPPTAGIILMEDIPNPHFDLTTCLLTEIPHIERCTYPRSSAIASQLTQVEDEAGSRDARVMVVRPAEWMCDRVFCPAVRDGVVMLSNTDHLSVKFARLLGARVQPILDSSLASMRPPAPRRTP